jgi:hypothetical protein
MDMKSEVKEQGRYSPISVMVALDPYLEDGWQGELSLTASDMTGNRVISEPVWVGVDTTPPELSLIGPVEGSVCYGTEQELTISFYDGTGSGPDITTVQFRSRTVVGEWSDWTTLAVKGTSRPDVLKATVNFEVGRTEVQLKGVDLAHNQKVSVTYVLDIMEPPVNLPPIPRIAHPGNGTRFYTGQMLELSATGTWDDGLGPNEELELTWSSSRDGYIGSGPLVYARLSVGQHNITLSADDGAPGHNISVSVTVHIVEYGGPVTDDDRPPGNDLIDPLSLFALFALLVVVMVLLVFVIIERKGGKGPTGGPEVSAGNGPDDEGPYGNEE